MSRMKQDESGGANQCAGILRLSIESPCVRLRVVVVSSAKYLPRSIFVPLLPHKRYALMIVKPNNDADAKACLR